MQGIKIGGTQIWLAIAMELNPSNQSLRAKSQRP